MPPPADVPDEPRRLAILGATGSIGTQTLDIVRLFPDAFEVEVLSGHRNAERLIAQARAFEPTHVVVTDDAAYVTVRDALAGTAIQVTYGQDGLCEAAALPTVDVVVAAVVGAAGMRSVLAALEAGKTVALANKEALVVAGHLVEAALAAHGGTLIPVDSEHSAIFQCLQGEPPAAVERLILTASGGPFRMRPRHTFADIKPEEALNHPNWSMGAKITIDSATLMNKGLEVMEARWLFGVGPDAIDVVVHPQSIIHSMVTFHDGSTKAQLGVPDMKVPIQYALTYPERWEAPHERLDWAQVAGLDFEPPDREAFGCLPLAYEALRLGGVAPAVLNAANEVAVARFLAGTLRFTEIPEVIGYALKTITGPAQPSLENLIERDSMARRVAQEHQPRRVPLTNC
ncbi:MAG: 1-deoxy-D-xylulose-5-phosphate reductoisomerase [Bacteroidota bacterium]